jgi:CheY-like chemotaxis protein
MTTDPIPGFPMNDPRGLILWAEDNPGDRILIKAALDDLETVPELNLVEDGVVLLEAMADAVPDLVVLDLKMPRLGGVDTLRRIRSHPDWNALPVTIFSSGNRPDEIDLCQSLGVREVAQKPVDFDAFSATVQRIVKSARPEMYGPPGRLVGRTSMVS